MMFDTTNYFFNKKVVDYKPETGITDHSVVYKLRKTWDDEEVKIEKLIAQFCADPKAAEATELVIGAWDLESGSSNKTVATLVEHAGKLPNLKALYFGDIDSEESELSWIENSNIRPILEAFPQLEHFQVKGGNHLSFGENYHSENLKSLIVETGGMNASILEELATAQLPNLELLELWLGTEDYGWDGNIEHIRPFLSKDLFPNLFSLGLKNSEISDEIAVALKDASILDIVTTLDLSMGTLGEKGGAALLDNKAIKDLNYLNLRHHYLSDDMMKKLEALDIKVNLDGQEADDEYQGVSYRYVEVGE